MEGSAPDNAPGAIKPQAEPNRSGLISSATWSARCHFATGLSLFGRTGGADSRGSCSAAQPQTRRGESPQQHFFDVLHGETLVDLAS
jgi:hypothetical protein